MKPYAQKFYNSNAWHKCRNEYINQRMLADGGMCEECHSAHGYIVHHIVHLNELNINDPDVTLNPDNLEYVCKECHDMFERCCII